MGQIGPIVDNFKVSKSGNQVLLNWRMLAGNTCNGITIYRATDTLFFQQIGQIPGICGSTELSVSYSHTDISPEKNRRNYYRLEFGGIGISEIISIDITDLGMQGYQIWPNPVLNEAKIFFRNDEGFEHVLKVFTLSGNQIYFARTNEDYFLFKPELLPGGFYLLTITTPDGLRMTTGKLIVQ